MTEQSRAMLRHRAFLALPAIAAILSAVLTVSERVRAWLVWLAGRIAMAVAIAVGTYARLTLLAASTTYTGNL